jgi:hypothetical protein
MVFYVILEYYPLNSIQLEWLMWRIDRHRSIYGTTENGHAHLSVPSGRSSVSDRDDHLPQKTKPRVIYSRSSLSSPNPKYNLFDSINKYSLILTIKYDMITVARIVQAAWLGETSCLIIVQVWEHPY